MISAKNGKKGISDWRSKLLVQSLWTEFAVEVGQCGLGELWLEDHPCCLPIRIELLRHAKMFKRARDTSGIHHDVDEGGDASFI